MEKSIRRENEKVEAYAELERGVYAALKTYSNVHRGSGHNSMVTTHLFERAREIVLDYLGLNKGKYCVIFCTPRRAAALKAQLEPESYQIVSSQDIGLSLGLRALAVKRKALPRGTPFQTGGGTASLVSPEWVIWADAPDKFEAGTPAIVSVIALARALQLIRQSGNDIFQDPVAEKLTACGILYHDELENNHGRELLHAFRKTRIGYGMLVPTVDGERPHINLDNGASTPTFAPILNAVCQTWRQPGKVQQEVIQEVRSICAEVLGAPFSAYDVIFTSNTTEAINLAAESLGREPKEDIEPVILGTLLEHSSNDLPWRMVPGCSLIRLSVDAEGFLDLKELNTVLCAYNNKGQYGKKRIKLVTVSGASNVLGVYNNLGEISRIVHQYGASLMVDAAQLIAHRKVEMEVDGIDYLAFSAHKVYAPFGCGVLVVKKGLLTFSPAEMELIRLSGEENAGGIAALGKALVLLQRIGMDLIREEEQDLTRLALHGLGKIADLRIYGVKDTDLPGFAQKGGVITFSLKGIQPNRVARELAERGGIGVRYGCHCAHILIKHMLGVSPLLARFQGLMLTLFPKIRLPGLVRVSLGIGNSREDIDNLIYMLGIISGKPGAKPDRNSASTHQGEPIPPKAEVQKRINDFVRASVRRVYSQG